VIVYGGTLVMVVNFYIFLKYILYWF